MIEKEKSDSDLMIELRNGRDQALSMLIARWQTPLFAFAFRYTQQTEDAADIVQEAFVRVYQHRARYRTDARFSTWIFTITANLCRNRARSRKRRPTVSLEHPEYQDFAESSWLADHRTDSPDEAMLKEERVQAVKTAIGELPHDLKTALLLYQYEDLSYKEIAAVVDCTVKAVESRLSRARKQLKKKLAQYLYNEAETKMTKKV